MALPTWDQLIRPVLELACEAEVTRNSSTEHVLKVVPMTEEEKKERIKSGPLKIRNRTGWAMSHLTKAKFIEKVAKATYKATSAGREFLAEHAGKEIDYHDLKKVDGFVEAWAEASEKRQNLQDKRPSSLSQSSIAVDSSTPDELIDSAYNDLNQSLSEKLLEIMHDMDPYKFEQLVVDLLFGMGYGGSRAEAAKVTQKSNDGGIDGIINEDRLGLDVIYIQAKRYQTTNTIGRQEIQSFVGALAGKQANKGVFITTSDFKTTAIEYAQSVPQKIILINGHRLAELMIEHDIGVSTERTIAIKRLDSDYFEDQ